MRSLNYENNRTWTLR